jgi:hypothetical protein
MCSGHRLGTRVGDIGWGHVLGTRVGDTCWGHRLGTRVGDTCWGCQEASPEVESVVEGIRCECQRVIQRILQAVPHVLLYDVHPLKHTYFGHKAAIRVAVDIL